MRHNIVSLKLKYITTVLPSTAVFFHGTYRGAKSVVPRNTTVYCEPCNHCVQWTTYMNTPSADLMATWLTTSR